MVPIAIKPHSQSPSKGRQIRSHSRLGNQLVSAEGTRATGEPMNSVSHARTVQLIKRLTGTAEEKKKTGPQEVKPMSQEIGCVFFSGGCTIPVIRGSRLSCLLALHTQKTHSHGHTQPNTRPQPGRRGRGRDGRRSCDISRSANTLADTQLHK